VIGLNADGSSKLRESDYQQLIERIKDRVGDTVPSRATTVVISRGDEQLLQLGERSAWHFPRQADGSYSGHHPVDSAEAISHLEELRGQGAGYLVLPSTAFWWLDFYDDFRRHLEEHYDKVVASSDCRIYRLFEKGSDDADTAPMPGTGRTPGATRDSDRTLNSLLESILPSGSGLAVLSVGSGPVPPGAEPWEPPPALADVEAAERELGALMSEGVEFLVIPRAAFEWLRMHPALGEALGRGHRLVTRQQHVCEIYELNPVHAQPSAPAPAVQSTASALPRARSLLQRLRRRAEVPSA
jgi:hypothetical protein